MKQPVLSRRTAIAGTGALVLGAWLRPGILAQTPVSTAPSLTVDLPGAPNTLDPALATSTRDWSVIHSIYDSVVILGSEGEIVPLAAETFETTDAVTWIIRLRQGLTFHDGSLVTSAAVERGITHVQQSDGPAARSFQAIESIEIIDELEVHLTTSAPAPWLPTQLATWHVLIPESATADSLATQPVGSGPYVFESLTPGAEVTLTRNLEYAWSSPKGQPLADALTFRAVPESATRVADLASGTANIIGAVDEDSRDAVAEAGGEVAEIAIFGTTFLRIATDAAPFDDPRVCQAVNLAIDVETIASTLVNPESHRLASLYPLPGSLGFDPDLTPFSYDPEQARQLLADAGYTDGIDIELEQVVGERNDVLEAIAAQLSEVGIRTTIRSTELATFNGSWKDPGSGQLRFVSWRPVFDPHTLLSLMFASTGPLSRSVNPTMDDLIAKGGAEPDSELRAGIYRELGKAMQEAPPAVFLWNLVSTYGVKDVPEGWKPRNDEWVLITGQGGQ